MSSELEILLIVIGLLVTTVLTGLIGMPILKRLQVGQTVRDDGPKSHFKKSGTPTFGGFFFLIPLVISAIVILIIAPESHNYSIIVLLMILFGFAGFLDDYIKVRVNKKGLSVRQKTFLLGLFSVLFTIYYLYLSPADPFILLPFSQNQIFINGWFKIPYGIIVVLYLFFVCNAVNLTDGVDGLASTVTAIAAAFTGLIAFMMGHLFSDSKALWLLPFAISGACIGFLYFNHYPAKVFMGDTGSQALGAAMAGICLLLGVPWLIIPVGIIYMAEAFSVIIQVAYYKKTGGKRIFRMSPIHHHYELGGWKEVKIVVVFSIITVIGGIMGIIMLLPVFRT